MVGGDERSFQSERGRILLFDDEPVILDLLALVLRKEGYRVTATPRSEEAVDLVCSRSFDLAITDLGLRKRDGCYVVRRLRQMSPKTPIVATTAYPASEIVSFAEEHAEALLPKPFAMGELLAAVHRALERRLGCDHEAGGSLVAAAMGSA